MPDPLVRAAAIGLAATFAWAAAAKIWRFASWRDALRAYGLGPVVEPAARVGTPLVEAGIAALLVAGMTKAGAAAALGLLAVFSLVLFSAQRRRGDRLPCGCFGGATTRDYRLMLLRNAALAALAGVVLAGREDLRPLEGWRAPATSEIVPALLVAAGIGLALVVAWQVDQAARRGRR